MVVGIANGGGNRVEVAVVVVIAVVLTFSKKWLKW